MDQGLKIPTDQVLQSDFRPAIVTWNRLEGRPRREEFDRSLRAEVRDPLWFLCRQWQLGEFIGEDGGSAIEAKVQVDTSRVVRYAAKASPTTGFDGALPLETLVEREPVPLDLATRIQIGRHWLRLLKVHTAGGSVRDYLPRFGFEDPEGDALDHLRSDQRAWQMLEAVRGRLVDGGRLLVAIRSGEFETFVAASAIADKPGAVTAATRLLGWFARVYSQPEGPEHAAWSPSHLEYQFRCSTNTDAEGEAQTVLVAEQYRGGHLDWYSFNIHGDPDERLQNPEGSELASGFERHDPISFIPSAIEFGGMPNVRWWEFEDQRTHFGDLRASTSDLALLFLAEFGLIYGNDWSLVPLELPVGSLAQVNGVVVKDVFGVRTFVRPAGIGADDDWQRWTMYNLSVTGEGRRADQRMFLPPVVGGLEESSPVERIVLTRDEMANMVWAIEETIPGVVGRGVDGREAASDLERRMSANAPSPSNVERAYTTAEIEYELGTSVPENWIPFIPVHKPDSTRAIRLQRASMPRLLGGGPHPSVTPRGVVLREGLDLADPQPYFIHQEEVAQSGVEVTRSFQRARWIDGRVVTWLGRRRKVGRGQGSSGLAFDRIVPK